MNQLSALSQVSGFVSNLSVENIKNEVLNLQSKIKQIKPPQEFFDVRRISKPLNFSEIQTRVAYNLKYFQSNYTLIVGGLFIYTLLTNLLLLFVIVFSFVGIMGINRLQGQDLITPFGSFKTSQLYSGLLLIAVPLGFLASPISTIMWLIGASAVTVLGHASLMEKPIETIFEETV
ncbi:hypothetical protein HANVADRAFT_52662 [Hanseniaspora valbyensis NRRL Y-1626]|uniref:PRA1 family protein n=1 Tax=Hanseniaspora valbyensis NRRL Y-1626 TaxID=766949 RepID=A0A1B7TDN8_9ASCO|nr:hypothetical protein HANVADRAFT_52662 [Hanseniaspora valbyensis NRRL Y-1626]